MGVTTGLTRTADHGPSWGTVAEDYLPATVAMDVVIGQSERVVVFISGVRVFPTGISLKLSARLMDGEDEEAANQLGQDILGDEWRNLSSPDADAARLSWWLEFSNGRQARRVDSALRKKLHAGPGTEPSRPIIAGGDGGGIGGLLSMDRDYWVWPLPSPGVLRVHCAWPALRVAPTVVELNADELLEAVGRARRLW